MVTVDVLIIQNLPAQTSELSQALVNPLTFPTTLGFVILIKLQLAFPSHKLVGIQHVQSKPAMLSCYHIH